MRSEMFKFINVLIILLWIVFVVTANKLDKYEGDFCTDSRNAVGRCTSFHLCVGVHSTIFDYNTRPILCGFNGTTPVVCCTSENLGQPNDKLRPKKVGDLANEYCNKYSLLTHTWVPSLLYNYNGTLIDMCRQTPQNKSDLPYPNPVPREYSFLVALAVGPLENIDYVCSGTLLSEQFVLTTISCAKNSGRGFVRWAVVGDFNLYEELDDAVPELSEVSFIITNTQSSSDLALVKLKHKFQINKYAIPACLPTSNAGNNKGFAVGWHMTKYQGDMSKSLLHIEPLSQCHNLLRGRNYRSNEPNLCAKPSMKSDYCQRTVGDPLVAHRPGIYCMYDVIGVTAVAGEPCDDFSLFADVKSNIAWLEQVIWGEGRPQLNVNQTMQNTIVAVRVGEDTEQPPQSLQQPVNGFNITDVFNSTKWTNRRKPPPLIRPGHHNHSGQNSTNQMCSLTQAGNCMPQNLQVNNQPQENNLPNNQDSFEIGDINRLFITQVPAAKPTATSPPPGNQNMQQGQSNKEQNSMKTVFITSASVNSVYKQIIWFPTDGTYRQSAIRTYSPYLNDNRNQVNSRPQDVPRPSVSLRNLIETERTFNFG